MLIDYESLFGFIYILDERHKKVFICTDYAFSPVILYSWCWFRDFIVPVADDA
jgi:hypothetical protein